MVASGTAGSRFSVCHQESVHLHFWTVSLFIKTSFSVGPHTEIVPGSSPDEDRASLAKRLQPVSGSALNAAADVT